MSLISSFFRSVCCVIIYYLWIHVLKEAAYIFGASVETETSVTIVIRVVVVVVVVIMIVVIGVVVTTLVDSGTQRAFSSVLGDWRYY